MAVKLSIEEWAKARLGYLWDYLPEAAREKTRREVMDEDKGKVEAFVLVDEMGSS